MIASRLLAGLAATAFWAATPAAAHAQVEGAQTEQASVISLALAKQIVDLGFPEETREAMFFATIDQMTSQMRTASLQAFEVDDEGALAILDAWIADYVAESKTILRTHIPALMDGMAMSYAAMFTEQELRDILAFVSTPSGQRFFELSSAIIAEPSFANANQAYMNEVQSLLPGAQEALVAELLEYFSAKEAAPESSDS